MKPRSSDETRPACGLEHDHDAPSLFLPENMLREARRQRVLEVSPVPPICVLDPDGDLLDYAGRRYGLVPMSDWACYHSHLFVCDTDAGRLGLIGKVVGAPYAVLVAELLFASGCRFLVNLSSAGQITDVADPPYFVLIDRALRDEGTSAHYLPPADEVTADPALLAVLGPALREADSSLQIGGSWTTDAPFRETACAVERARIRGLLVVEMEAAGLYAFARARRRDVMCLAHVTNRLGQPGDFGKGAAHGAADAFALVGRLSSAWSHHRGAGA